MAPTLTSEAWAQIRYDYEHTERPIEDICAEHRISSGTLRDRMRRWRWTRRRPPIPDEGPPPLPAPQIAAAFLPPRRESDPAAFSVTALPQIEAASLPAAPHPGAAHLPSDDAAAPPREPDDTPIVPRLQSGVARALSAIETTLATLGAGRMHPREMERTARALAALTRTLRELNGLLGQQQASQAPAADDGDEPPKDIDEFRLELARRIHAFVDAHENEDHGGAEPQET
jgi:hypothetical protein